MIIRAPMVLVAPAFTREATQTFSVVQRAIADDRLGWIEQGRALVLR